MDGFRLAELIRQRPEEKGAILLLLSSASAAGDADRCRALGVAGCLTKPIKQADLCKAILAALGTPMPAAEGADRHARAAPVTPQPAEPRRRLRVLLAEDNPVNQRLAVTLLQKQGHRGDGGRQRARGAGRPGAAGV